MDVQCVFDIPRGRTEGVLYSILGVQVPYQKISEGDWRHCYVRLEVHNRMHFVSLCSFIYVFTHEKILTDGFGSVVALRLT